MNKQDVTGYRYRDAELNCAHAYLLPSVQRNLDSLSLPQENRRLFELGCGNGSTANVLAESGWEVTGVDPSVEGMRAATAAYPHSGSAYDDLEARYGRYPVVLSLEVVEHVYAPRDYARTVFNLLEEGGAAILSTPYHGYWKNLALALTGRMDAHFTALWDHGHIKFWSLRTLTELLREAGFTDIRFERVGRLKPVAKSMIAIARRR